MTDLSDGLLLDAARMAAASRVRAELWADRIPLAAGLSDRFGADAIRVGTTGGEDYELLACIPRALAGELMRAWPTNLRPLTVVGRVVEGAGVVLLVAEGGAQLNLRAGLGYRHF
jgi:thiamine-monophosphate kinase